LNYLAREDELYPFMARGGAHRMGVVRCRPADAVLAAPSGEALDLRREVTARLRGSNVRSILSARRMSEVLNRIGAIAGGRAFEDLAAVNAGIEEDVFILDVARGSPRLAGFAACFPSRWDPRERLGQGVEALHGPVPHVEGLLGPIERFLGRIGEDDGFYRLSWSLTDDPNPDQFQVRHAEDFGPPIDASTALDVVYYRYEIQHFAAVPQAEAVLFILRIRQTPVRSLLDRPDLAAGLAAALADWDAAMRAYKGWGHYGDALLAALAS